MRWAPSPFRKRDGNIRTITDGNGKVHTYTYNDYGEVVKAEEAYTDGTKKVYEYTYDAGGNITEEKVSSSKAGKATGSVTSTYGYANVWKDQLTTYRIGDTTYNITYDGAGHPLDYMGASLTWNETGNLTSIQTGTNPYMASGANQTIAYTYLSDGTRRTKTVNGRTTTYHYNNGLLLSETTVNANGTGTAETLSYYYGSTGKLASITYRKGNNTPVSYFYAYNGQGDVIALYRSSDSVLIGTYEYDLWGRPVSVKEATAGIDTDGILTKNPFRYRGYYYDEETGFYYLNARYYDPQVRRFISADDMAYLGADGTITGYNLFAYCANNPVIREDSNGHFSWKTVFVAAAVVTVVAVAVVAVVASGGAAGALIVATTGNIVGTTVTAMTVTTVAMDVAIAGGVTATAAGVGTIIEESRQQSGESVDNKERVNHPIGRRYKYNSRKEAKEAAKRAGKGKEPIHHNDESNGPHYHPNVKNKFRMTPKAPCSHDHYFY